MEREGRGGGSLTYHCFDGVTLRSGDGHTGTTFRCIVPSLERKGSAEEVAWEGVAGERACSAGDVAAVEGGFAGVSVGGTGGDRFARSRLGGRGGSGRFGRSAGSLDRSLCGGSAGNFDRGLSGGSAGNFDGSLSGGGLRGSGLHGWGSNGLHDSGSLS